MSWPRLILALKLAAEQGLISSDALVLALQELEEWPYDSLPPEEVARWVRLPGETMRELVSEADRWIGDTSGDDPIGGADEPVHPRSGTALSRSERVARVRNPNSPGGPRPSQEAAQLASPTLPPTNPPTAPTARQGPLDSFAFIEWHDPKERSRWVHALRSAGERRLVPWNDIATVVEYLESGAPLGVADAAGLLGLGEQEFLGLLPIPAPVESAQEAPRAIPTVVESVPEATGDVPFEGKAPSRLGPYRVLRVLRLDYRSVVLHARHETLGSEFTIQALPAEA